MEKSKIQEHIIKGGDYYLKLLADAKHMNVCDDGFCTFIYPNKGERGATSIFNFRFDGMSDEEIDQKIKEIKEKNIHTFWGYMPENVLNIFRKHYPEPNVAEEDPEAYMALFLEEKPEYKKFSSPITIKKVDNHHDFKIWADIVNNGLHDGYEIIHPENHYHLCESGKMPCYLGFYDGVPVSTSATMNNNSIASLEFIATLKDFRKRGLGNAVCVAAIDDLFKEEATMITLRAFPMGKPLYKTLGFKEY